MFYLTTQIGRERDKTRCHHRGYSFRLAWTLETILTCLYPYTVQTRPLAGTASGMASDSVRGRGIHPISSKGSFICIIPHRRAHTTAFVTLVVEHWLEREIAQWVHPMKDRSDDPSRHELNALTTELPITWDAPGYLLQVAGSLSCTVG